MKKLFLILLTLIAVVACDDNFKRETPQSIQHTIWESTTQIDTRTSQSYHLKLYDTTFDLVIETSIGHKIIETTSLSGQYTYKLPKVTLMCSNSEVIYGMVMAHTMLLSNNVVLHLTNYDSAF